VRRAALLAALAGGLAGAVAAPAAATPYVVTLQDDVEAVRPAIDSLERDAGFTATLRYATALKGFAADLSSDQVAEVMRSGLVASVAADAIQKGAGTPVVTQGDLAPPGMRRIGVPSLGTVHNASGTGVAILDTGIDLANPDLDVAGGTNCVSPGAAPRDDNGHGTHVAGIVGARNDGRGIVGVAPGTRLYAVKVLNGRNAGSLSALLCGLNWVAANAEALDIRVANLSVAGPGTNDNNCGRSNRDPEHRAICAVTDAGVTFVAAAGNASRGFGRTVPAAYPEVLTVTAMTDTDGFPGRHGPPAACRRGERDDVQASYSNYPSTAGDAVHTLAAPGTCIVSDRPGGGTATYYGTSQAAPHVAGAVALCVDHGGRPGPCAGLTSAQVITRVRADAAAGARQGLGFIGDPLQPIGRRSAGWLVRTDGY
jgi:subtilisin family serine protease